MKATAAVPWSREVLGDPGWVVDGVVLKKKNLSLLTLKDGRRPREVEMEEIFRR